MIKVSASEFYREVTGTSTVNRHTVIPALKRWGVPVPEEYRSKTRVFDAALIPTAKELYAKEQAEREARREVRPSRANGHEADMSFIREALIAQNAALGRIESVANKLLAEWTSPRHR